MFNKEFLKEVLSVQSYSGDYKLMTTFLKKILDGMHDVTYTIDKHDNIYVTKGNSDIYPCIVAHTDTVHQVVKEFIVVELDDAIFGWNPRTMAMSGIGGDDKVGIYLALQCLYDYDHLKVVFFADEEIGCIGSKAADMKFFKDCSLVLQGDRRGNDEFINNSNSCELFGDEFTDAVTPILEHNSYKMGTGTITDVGQLKRNGLDIACSNVACGYYNAHSHDEVVSINDVNDCLNLFTDIIEQLGYQKRWVHTYEYVPHVYKYTTGCYGPQWSYNRSSKKKESETDEKVLLIERRDRAMKKIDRGVLFQAECPDCKNKSDFYSTGDGGVMCGQCYGGADEFTMIATEDYQQTVDECESALYKLEAAAAYYHYDWNDWGQ